MKTATQPLLKKVTNRENVIAELHENALAWISKLEFNSFELNFVKGLIDSYHFEPKTSNSFLLLQEFTNQIERFKKEGPLLMKHIKQHENGLGGMYDCKDAYCDATYLLAHKKLEDSIQKFLNDFSSIKQEIFDYCENILRYKKKPLVTLHNT